MTNKNCDVNLPATVLVYKRYLLSSKNSATKRNSVKKTSVFRCCFSVLNVKKCGVIQSEMLETK